MSMTNESRITIGVIIMTVGLVGALVWWGGRAGGSEADLPDDIKDAAAADSTQYPVGDLINEGDFVDGSTTAPVTLIEFSDFECPYCKETHPIIEGLRELFTAEQLRLAFRHLPIVEIHNEAYPAAKAVSAAHRQGKFQEYAAAVFQNSTLLNDAQYVAIAQQFGLNIDQFNADRSSPEIAWQAYRARELFKQKGWQISTPTIVINGEVYKGDRTAEALSASITALLPK